MATTERQLGRKLVGSWWAAGRQSVTYRDGLDEELEPDNGDYRASCLGRQLVGSWWVAGNPQFWMDTQFRVG